MLRIIKWIGVPVLAVALLTGLDSPKAEAGNGFSLRIGGFGISTGNGGYGHHRGFNSYYGARQYRGGFHGGGHYGGHSYGGHSYGHRGWYHDTTHLDYHPTQVIRHGHHFHVQPGHYDVHRTGHWHR